MLACGCECACYLPVLLCRWCACTKWTGFCTGNQVIPVLYPELWEIGWFLASILRIGFLFLFSRHLAFEGQSSNLKLSSRASGNCSAPKTCVLQVLQGHISLFWSACKFTVDCARSPIGHFTSFSWEAFYESAHPHTRIHTYAHTWRPYPFTKTQQSNGVCTTSFCSQTKSLKANRCFFVITASYHS